jgi:DNA modification methylase
MTETEANEEPILFLEEPKEPYGQLEDEEGSLNPPTTTVITGDAADTGLPDKSVDLIVTSPPYWRKRDYGVDGQIGLEATPAGYVESIMRCMREWRRVLTDYGSVFLNVGDTYLDRSLAGVPAMIEFAAHDEKWVVRNRIIWAKTTGMPEPASNRLGDSCMILL